MHFCIIDWGSCSNLPFAGEKKSCPYLGIFAAMSSLLWCLAARAALSLCDAALSTAASKARRRYSSHGLEQLGFLRQDTQRREHQGERQVDGPAPKAVWLGVRCRGRGLVPGEPGRQRKRRAYTLRNRYLRSLCSGAGPLPVCRKGFYVSTSRRLSSLAGA